MILYPAIFNLLILLRYALMRRGRVRDKVYWVVLALLVVFSAFRFEVGCDWTGYLNQWQIQQTSTFVNALTLREPTWWALMHGLQSLGLSYPWINVASTLPFFIGVHVLARRQPDPLGFLILLFPILIINMPMSALRQGVAIGLLCIAFSSFIDKRLFWFVAWTALASTFHNSAIIFLLLAPLVGGQFSFGRLILAAVLAIPGGFVLLTGASAELAVTRYVGTGVDAAGAAARAGLLLITGVAYFLLVRGKWRRSFPQDDTLVSVGALMMVGLILIVPVSAVIGDRLGYYLIPIQAMIFARLPYLQMSGSRAFFAAAPYVLLVLVLIIWTQESSHFKQCFTPYQSWLFGVPANVRYLY